MSHNFAFVFPGQGSQHLGMLSELAVRFPIIIETFHRASDKLGYDLWRLSQEGPEEKLNQTEFTQPALLAAGFSMWKVWEKLNAPSPAYLAGHSLGEYTALVCANVLDFVTAVKLVEQRGRFMQEAVPPGEGGMAAIIGLDDKAINEVCKEASDHGRLIVAPANYNSIGQTVIAGASEAIDKVVMLAKAKGAKLAKKLPVSVPSHCDLMRPAALQLNDELQRITLKKPDLPVIHNVDVCYHQDPNEIRNALVNQLYSPVRWVETIQYFASNELPSIIESGPGKVLTGLNKRITSEIKAVAIGEPDSLQEVLNTMGE